MSKRCRLMFFFHMHQPYYKELRNQTYKMPWVRLHALKNYADFPALHQEFPDVRIAYNLVPSLLEQIEDYAGGATDNFEQLSRKAAADLREEEKEFILGNFFQINKKTQIDPVPRYRELLSLKGSQSREVSPSALRSFSNQDFLDLQVHFNLAWSGWSLRENQTVAALIEKGKRFTEKEKNKLLDIQREFLGTILDPYRQTLKSGTAELTTSPFYHPILPLLCDTASATEAVPGIELPAKRFSWPDDAEDHIRQAKQKHKELFGSEPRGMWPSEGSISRKACELMARNGITWAASDNVVLAHSLGVKSGNLSNEDLYSPWELQTNEGPLNLFFRDTEFSDLLGFTYQYWDAGKAVNDFIGRLESVSDSFPSGKTPLVPVILDGENAWAYYKDNGREFLSTLFKAVQETNWIETILPSQYIDSAEHKPKELNRLVAGSWIYGNLTTWIGHQEKNRAWELLATAREDFEEHAGSAAVSEDDKALARKELFIAEGSDWFWWYGDDHETAYAREFDSLFREHLANIYHFLRLDPPQELFKSIKGSDVQSDIEPPLRLISPTLDGYVTRYTEWINSGLYFSSGGSEMMHKASGLLKCIRYGFDEKNIYLRFDGTRPFTEKPLAGHHLTVKITAPKQARIQFDFDKKEAPVLKCDDRSQELEYGIGSHLEFAVPWRFCGEEVFAFYAVLSKDDEEVEIHPRNNVISIHYGDANYNAMMWRV